MYRVSVLKHKGFSLIELMIVVAIVAIIASVALPSYFDSVERSRRAEGKAFLLDLAARQERFYTLNSRYQTTGELAGPTSENGFYTADTDIRDDNTTATTYVLSAVPLWNQTLACGDLTLSNTGVRGVTGTADANLCWR